MDLLGKDVLLLLLSRHAELGDALAVAQCFAIGRRAITDEWLDQAFSLPRKALEHLLGKHGRGRSYRQLLNALFLTGAFFFGSLRNTSGPFNDGTCYLETSVWVSHVAGSDRLVRIKAISDDYGDGYRDLRTGEGTARVALDARGRRVTMRAEKAAIQKSRERNAPSKEVGVVMMELPLTESAAGPMAMLVEFAGVSDKVTRR